MGVDRFSTEAFKFIADHPFVFVHCQIRICDASNPGSRCAQGCIKEARLRRDVSDEDKLYPLARGPLTIASDATEMKSRKRSNKKGTCSFDMIQSFTTLNSKRNVSVSDLHFVIWRKINPIKKSKDVLTL